MTLKDIARLAEVSHMTVSRVINGTGYVSPETRERVLRVIEENNFVPSASARALISGRTNVIGMLVMYDLSQFPHDFLPPILEGMSFVLNQNGYGTALFFDQVNGKKNVAPESMLAKGQVDGLLIVSVERDSAIRKRIQRLNVPIVLVNQRIDIPGVGYVVTDDCNGAYCAVEHLIQNGHRNIGFLQGTPRFSTSMERQCGYEKALSRYGLPLRPEYCRVANFDNETSYEQTKLLLAQRPEITAIFAANDAMALGAYRAVNELGLSIPRDLSVIGYDNQEYCQFIQPPLTTVRKHRRSMGEHAARLIVDAVENRADPQKLVMQPDLVLRQSVRRLEEEA